MWNVLRSDYICKLKKKKKKVFYAKIDINFCTNLCESSLTTLQINTSLDWLMWVILELECVKLSHFPILHFLIQMLLTSSSDVICNFELFLL